MLSIGMLVNGCKEECPELELAEVYTLITPKETYEVGFKKDCEEDFYVLNDYDDLESVLIQKFGYGGNFKYAGEFT